jgi:ferritin-like metal-binding protein YciE
MRAALRPTSQCGAMREVPRSSSIAARRTRLARSAVPAGWLEKFCRHHPPFLSIEETEKQIGRLDQVFKMLEQKPKGVKCPAIDGIIAEADELAGEVADKQVLDAAIVGSAQAVEHYEIARYGTLIAWADELGRDDIVRLLTTTLNEEKAADKKLSTVALRKGVNRKAAS